MRPHHALQVVSTLADRYQATVSETVRRTLLLRERHRIRYTVRPDGEALISRAIRDDEPIRHSAHSLVSLHMTSPRIPNDCMRWIKSSMARQSMPAAC